MRTWILMVVVGDGEEDIIQREFKGKGIPLLLLSEPRESG